jgi:hypothetical protein
LEALFCFIGANTPDRRRLTAITSPFRKEIRMPKYLIERRIPNADTLSALELQAIAQKFCGVVVQMGSQLQWVRSYVAGDKFYCTFIAPNEEAVREHARRGGFPIDRVAEVRAVLDPTTAEEVIGLNGQ